VNRTHLAVTIPGKKSRRSATLLFVALCLGACMSTEPEHDASVGTLEVPLISTGSKGTVFALAGTFSLDDSEMLSVLVSPTDGAFTTDDVVTMQPRVGAYHLMLSDWALFDLTENPAVPTPIPSATLVSAADVPVSIVANQTARVTYEFFVPGSGVVTFQRGTLDIDFTVTEQGNADGATGLACVKVNEVSPTGTGGPSDEFVELYNTCTSPVDMTGARLVYRSMAGNADASLVSFTSGALIPANGYQVFGSPAEAVAVTAPLLLGLSPTGGGVAIRDAMLTIVDSVAYGAATNGFAEGMPVAAPSIPNSIARHPNGIDTNNNSSDFSAQVRTPLAPNL
jgi:Lamin Tail Domain